ncbi:hypothetical protein B1812_12375 [Methylocystis bryophila]|uniref:Uncharacterized protein n=1 Tax=Methylocystis bryophila TaxID=655015 RepID=A0A1W6MVY6_9HYPH|nr:hypothetical protein B1812_12375 [Methylocystis bryophila]
MSARQLCLSARSSTDNLGAGVEEGAGSVGWAEALKDDESEDPKLVIATTQRKLTANRRIICVIGFPLERLMLNS